MTALNPYEPPQTECRPSPPPETSAPPTPAKDKHRGAIWFLGALFGTCLVQLVSTLVSDDEQRRLIGMGFGAVAGLAAVGLIKAWNRSRRV